MKKPRKKLRLVLLAAGSAGVLLLLVAVLAGGALLTAVGRSLIFQKTDFRQVDDIVILGGSVPDRAFEAVKLFEQHRGKRLVLIRERRHEYLKELDRLGIHIPDDWEINRTILTKQGVPEGSIEVLPGDVDSTWEEAVVFSRYAREQRIKSAVVVTCGFHTRRAYLNFRKACASENVDIYMVASRYCADDPSRWWKERDQLKLVYIEVANLIAYAFGFR